MSRIYTFSTPLRLHKCVVGQLYLFTTATTLPSFPLTRCSEATLKTLNCAEGSNECGAVQNVQLCVYSCRYSIVVARIPLCTQHSRYVSCLSPVGFKTDSQSY
jgi:hypothetical protein